MDNTTYKTPITEDPRASKESRAKRLESLRGLTRLSRHDFAKKCGVKPGSFQNWEGPRFGGLTEKAAKKILRGIKNLGIYCTLEWLMFGIGPGPQIDERLYLCDSILSIREPTKTYLTNDDEMQRIAEELLVFRKHYPDALDFMIRDDGMGPNYKIGEYVAGAASHYQDIETLLGLDCIIKTLDGDVMLRSLKKGSSPQRYTLVCTNPHTTVEKPTLYDVELMAAAPIMWIRRRHPRA